MSKELHPRIKELYSKASENHKDLTDIDSILKSLSALGATQTEASIVLHQCFNFEIEEADKRVLKLDIWPDETYVETMYQVAKYLHGDKTSPSVPASLAKRNLWE